MGRLLLVILISLSPNSVMGQLSTDGAVQFELLANGDVQAAKAISNLNLFAVATNLWWEAQEQPAGRFIVRAALDKPRYQQGEPVHLFLYRLHHSTDYTRRAKASGWEIIRPIVTDRRNVPIALSPIGQWHDSFSNLFVMGFKSFPTNRVLINHIDLTELTVLDQPGEYLVYPKILLYPGESRDPDLPSSVELLPIPFEVTTDRFERPADAPASDLAAIYGQKLDELAGRSPPPSELERDRPLLEAMAAARAAETASNQAARAEAEPHRPSDDQPDAEQPDFRRPWRLLAVTGGLLLWVVGWMWRKRSR